MGSISGLAALVIAVGSVPLRTTGVAGQRFGGDYSAIGLVTSSVAILVAAGVVAFSLRVRGAIGPALALGGSTFLFLLGGLYGVGLDDWTSNLMLAALPGAAAGILIAFTTNLPPIRGLMAVVGSLLGGLVVYSVLILIESNLIR